MKWYNKAHHRIFSKQLGMALKRIKRGERDVLRFTPLVLKFTRKVGLEESKVGVLGLQDIQQAAFSGLFEGWSNVDWEKVDESDNPDKTIVNYLSSYIERQLKREIYRDAVGTRIPEYLITRTKKEISVDKLFGNWLYNFKLDDYSPGTMVRYIDVIDFDASRSSSHENDMLNDKLTTLMFKYLNDKERDIIRWNFGLDDDKLSMKEIANRLKMSEIGVKKAKRRALDKLLNEESEDILKDFL